MVKNHAQWDYKQLASKDDKLQQWAYEDFGNWHYGLVGAAAGIPLPELLRGAGIAQSAAGTSSKGWGKWYGKEPYGDDPLDQYWIRKGYKAYKEAIDMANRGLKPYPIYPDGDR